MMPRHKIWVLLCTLWVCDEHLGENLVIYYKKNYKKYTTLQRKLLNWIQIHLKHLHDKAYKIRSTCIGTLICTLYFEKNTASTLGWKWNNI